MGDQTSLALADKTVEDEKTWLQLEDPRAIRFMENLEHRTMIAPFFKEPKTVSEASKKAAKPFRKMYYIVDKAVRLGLLKISDIQERKGRAMKRYRCAADVLFVPYSLMTQSLQASLEKSERNFLPSLLDATLHSHPFETDLSHDEEWGTAYTIGKPQYLTTFPNSSKRRFTSYRGFLDYLIWEHPKTYLNSKIRGLRLSPEHAKAWQHELLALNEKYVKLSGEGAKHYARIFLAEMPEDE